MTSKGDFGQNYLKNKAYDYAQTNGQLNMYMC